MIGRILPITCIIVPFWLVRAVVGWKETFEITPAILVVGISFGSMQFFWANHMDSNLVDIMAGLFSLVVTVVFLLFWKPKTIWRFPHERGSATASGAKSGGASPAIPTYTRGQVAKAWMPFLVLSVFVFLWGYPSVKGYLNRHTTPHYSPKGAENGWDFPVIQKAISRDVPVAKTPTPENIRYDFNWFTATGTACFLAAIVSGLLLRVYF